VRLADQWQGFVGESQRLGEFRPAGVHSALVAAKLGGGTLRLEPMPAMSAPFFLVNDGLMTAAKIPRVLAAFEATILCGIGAGRRIESTTAHLANQRLLGLSHPFAVVLIECL
jgi:hypothetical protein